MFRPRECYHAPRNSNFDIANSFIMRHLNTFLFALTLACTAYAQDATPVSPTSATPLEAIARGTNEERIENLKKFLAENTAPNEARTRAVEQLVGSFAARGDELLASGDGRGGIEMFRQAVTVAPIDMSERLFVAVVAQLPSNLYLRGEQAAAIDLAKQIERKVGTDASRLLALATFYLGIEQGAEAARVAGLSLRYKESANAHIAIGAARRLNLDTEAAINEYRRALELDGKSNLARRTLADLYRATNNSTEAIKLYQQQLIASPDDALARAGLVLSLFDANRRDEAEKEMSDALATQSANLPLLVGAAYGFAARNEPARALELAERAVQLEPRYTWANIALARALVGLRRPLEAERALRLAKQYGDFPTLTYELATALAAAGLYEEAATELRRDFQISNQGVITTNLARRIKASHRTFTELLAPERRAAIFQFAAADTEQNARTLAALLAFQNQLNVAQSTSSTRASSVRSTLPRVAPRTASPRAPTSRSSRAAAPAGEAVNFALAENFVAGDDEMKFFRLLYVIERTLNQRSTINEPARVQLQSLIETATAALPAALNAPNATVATLADELRAPRFRAIATGATPSIPELPRANMTAILRGRLEAATGRVFAQSGSLDEALTHFKRAGGILPPATAWATANAWRLGSALEAKGENQPALTAYIQSYLASPDAVRRAVIESLYKRLNQNSLEGLDELLRGVAQRTPQQ